MFTGIIEEVGKVKTMLSDGIIIAAKKVLSDVNIGDSIAVNGVCLTVVSFTDNNFTVDVMPETFRSSNLGSLKAGSEVNLERAMAADGRFGGHIVSGHIDAYGTITEIRREGNAVIVEIEPPCQLLKNIVHKGSIAIDGISLTVAYVKDNKFAVSVIPHTGKETILLRKKQSDTVNLECDVIGKYVENFMNYYINGNTEKMQTVGSKSDSIKSNITTEFLNKNGFF